MPLSFDFFTIEDILKIINEDQNDAKFINYSLVFLLRQLWIVNYYVRSSSNNLSNENIVSREIIFQK